MSDYSSKLRKLRQEAGHTQESMASSLGIDTSTVNRMESGKRKINMEIIPKIAQAVKKTPEDVMKYLLEKE